MPRLPATLLACLALAAGGAIAGCGSDDEDSSGSSPPPPPAATTTQAATTASADVVEVGMKNIKFVPADITVKLGQTVKWTNTDGDITHNVTSQTDSEDFSSGSMEGGATFEYKPKKAGKIDYVCTIHSGQSGTITVTE